MYNATRSHGWRRELRRLGRVALLASLVVATALAGCRADGTGSSSGITTPPDLSARLTAGSITVPPTMPFPDGYDLADTRGVDLTPVTGKPGPGGGPPPVAMSGGTSVVRGQLNGVDGPVPCAVVRIERFADGGVGRLDLTADGQGRYRATGLPGGRYRVRAWRAPSDTVVKPQLLFLAADHDEQVVDLGLDRRNASLMSGWASAGSWIIGQRINVAVQVTPEYVDDDGVVRAGGVAGASITLTVQPGVSLASGGTSSTGSDGYAWFSVGCDVPGSRAVVASANGYNRTIGLPLCKEPPTTTTTTAPPATAPGTPSSGTAPPGAAPPDRRPG